MGNNSVTGVLLDTNLLLYAYDGLDIFEKILNFLDYKPLFFIHKRVLDELNKIENSNRGRQLILNKIRVAKILLEKYKSWWKIISEDSDEYKKVDEVLIETSIKYKLWLATSDYKLCQIALKKGVTVLYVTKNTNRLILIHPDRVNKL
ncbi:MAG: twitching motility protein PilT [Sulfolobaceae archaeon]